MEQFTYIDLFSGAGGLSLGFDKAGFKNIMALEKDLSCAETYKYNFPSHKLVVSDIRDFSDEYILKFMCGKKVDVIIGGPPCQGFSIAGNIGRSFIEDERNKLFLEFARFVKVLKPKVFIMENVEALKNHNKGKTMEEIIEHFSNIGYSIVFEVLNTVEYEVPQQRRRIFIVGEAGAENHFVFPKKSEKRISIKEAIDDLPKLKSGENSNIPNHNAMNHSKQMLEKMSYIKDGGNRMDIPEELRPKSGDIRKYIRYKSSEPSICITGDMRKVFHYSQNRALTCRELARIQTFPDDFVFLGNSGKIQQQIGNAVPPVLAFKLAENVKKLLNSRI